MECLLPYLRMVTVPHIMVGLERMLDYRGVGLARFHCIWGVPDLTTRPRALRALGTRDKSDTPRIDMIQIEHIHYNIM